MPAPHAEWSRLPVGRRGIAHAPDFGAARPFATSRSDASRLELSKASATMAVPALCDLALPPPPPRRWLCHPRGSSLLRVLVEVQRKVRTSGMTGPATTIRPLGAAKLRESW